MCLTAHQEQFWVQYLTQGHFDMQTRGIEPVTFRWQIAGSTAEPHAHVDIHRLESYRQSTYSVIELSVPDQKTVLLIFFFFPCGVDDSHICIFSIIIIYRTVNNYSQSRGETEHPQPSRSDSYCLDASAEQRHVNDFQLHFQIFLFLCLSELNTYQKCIVGETQFFCSDEEAKQTKTEENC